MPKGDNPNSRKNLEKGKEYRFVKGDTQGKIEAVNKSNEVQRKKREELKTFKQYLLIALSQPIKNSEGEEKEIKEAIMLKVIKKALQGDQKAIEYITKMIGEDVGQTITINQPLNVDINQIKKINEEIDKK